MGLSAVAGKRGRPYALIVGLFCAFLLLARLGTAGEAASPGFDSEDPVRWAERNVQFRADGPRLRLMEGRGAAQLPLRNPDTTLFLPEESFPDWRESAAVMRAVERYMALGENDSQKEYKHAFSGIADAAEAWARSILGTLPAEYRQAQKALRGSRWNAFLRFLIYDAGYWRRLEALQWEFCRKIQSRLISNPALPVFHEFENPDMSDSAAGLTGAFVSWDGARAGGWEDGKAGTLLVAYKKFPVDKNTEFESYRAHEWSHVVDLARLSAVNGRGERLRELEVKEMFFTEAKAYALSFLIDSWGFGNFREYLAYRLRGYDWIRSSDGFKWKLGLKKTSSLGKDLRYRHTVLP